MNELEVNSEFIEENKANLGQFMPKLRKRGPYSKKDKEARRNEVYKLHFEYGYSARKIAELMKVSRNTINCDITFWYSKILDKKNVFDPEYVILLNLQRLEIQRSRLREQLDKTNFNQEKLALERLIFDIDSKILYTHNRLAESAKRVMNIFIRHLNNKAKEDKKSHRYITMFDRLSVSEKAQAKIEKIIEEDKKRGDFL